MSYHKLIVVCPSYGRPENAWRLKRAFDETVKHPNTQLMFVTDLGDVTESQYPAGQVSPSRGMPNALNYGAALALEYGATAIGFFGDDHLPRTTGWDVRYLLALKEQKGGIVWGNDLIQGARIPTQVAMDAKIVAALGYMVPQGFRHLFIDDMWLAIGQSVNKATYLPDVVVEHLHPLGNTADWDEHYSRVNDSALAQEDQQAFARWRGLELPKIKETLWRLYS